MLGTELVSLARDGSFGVPEEETETLRLPRATQLESEASRLCPERSPSSLPCARCSGRGFPKRDQAGSKNQPIGR